MNTENPCLMMTPPLRTLRDIFLKLSDPGLYYPQCGLGDLVELCVHRQFDSIEEVMEYITMLIDEGYWTLYWNSATNDFDLMMHESYY